MLKFNKKGFANITCKLGYFLKNYYVGLSYQYVSRKIKWEIEFWHDPILQACIFKMDYFHIGLFIKIIIINKTN
jgi:hypothetical protein